MIISKKQELVLKAIRQNPGVENNDANLIAAVWRLEQWDEGRSLEENISRMTRPETITRRRRELHQMGLIDYSPEADKMREEAYINERDVHGEMPFNEEDPDLSIDEIREILMEAKDRNEQ